MKLIKREKKFKDCPRCGMRCLNRADSCPECGLVFSRLELATNKDAKAKIKRGDKEYIIRTSTLPHDVNFFVLISLCVFGGLFGAHSFYVGRYWRGCIALTVTTILIGFTVFNAEMIAIDGTGQTLGMISTVLGFFLMLWPIDIVLIFMKKYRVPVAIDIDKHSVPLNYDGIVDDQEQTVSDTQKEILNDVAGIKVDKENNQKEEDK